MDTARGRVTSKRKTYDRAQFSFHDESRPSQFGNPQLIVSLEIPQLVFIFILLVTGLANNIETQFRSQTWMSTSNARFVGAGLNIHRPRSAQRKGVCPQRIPGNGSGPVCGTVSWCVNSWLAGAP
jgi:hypothetical protein